MKSRILIYPLMALGFTLSIASCCRDDNEPRKGKSTAVFNPDKTYGTVKDIDGNVYRTITIGTQTWMAENLRVTHYRNGDPIPNVKEKTDLNQWRNLTTGAYCSYKDTNDPDSIATFGFLYNGYAVTDSRGLAPEGWHIPTDDEWSTLVSYVNNGDGVIDSYGTSSIVGGRLKETGLSHWNFPNRFADNSSGFTAISGGERTETFAFEGFIGSYWSSSQYVYPFLLVRTMSTDFASIGRGQYPCIAGLPVRCIKN